MTRTPAAFATLAAVSFLFALSTPALHSMGTESFGNSPVTAQEGWAKGVVAVASGPGRLYTHWINGNESFYFLGKTAALNEALKLFAKIEDQRRELVLLPGPGEARTFDGARLPCDWKLMVPSGIYLNLARKEAGTEVFVKQATLTVYVTPGRLELDELAIPPGVRVLGEKDLLDRYLRGLGSADAQVRGQAAYHLGSLPRAEGIIPPLVRSLKDPDDYVVLCAAGVLGELGRAAAASLPALRENLEGRKEQVRRTLDEAIRKIEAPEPTRAEAHRAINEAIDRKK